MNINDIRRTTHDFCQRLRLRAVSYGNQQDAVERLSARELTEEVTRSMCDYLGVTYYPPTDAPPLVPQGTDKAAKARAKSPWGKKRLNLDNG